VQLSIEDVPPPVATAQNTDTAASAPTQSQKTKRKAVRKAARVKKNAELKTLEQSGYQPGRDQLDYPLLREAVKKAGMFVARAT
jgi:hypothetical protein